jgi:two-component sensor histidine kinase
VAVARADDDRFTVSVRDEGAGLPADFDLRKAKGLGMRIIGAFSRQLSGTVTLRPHNPGTEFIVTIPRRLPRP